MKITFLGAAETVTGSSYLVETGKTKFLVDCGMFQGPDVEDRNYEDFLFDPAELDFMILTHCHIDHSGLIPKLFRNNFKGDIYMTAPTSQIVELLLMDAAKIQENKNRDFGNTQKGWQKKNFLPKETDDPLYASFDSIAAIKAFKTVKLDKELKISNDVTIELINAGHVLGAASVILTTPEKKVLFSGDIGHKGQDIVTPFDVSKKIDVDYVIMESLYGGIVHESRKESQNNLISIMSETLKRNGNVMIPAFAAQRTQEMLYLVKAAKKDGLIHNNVQVFLDSPLAYSITKVYTNNIASMNDEVKQLGYRSDNIFSFPGMKIIRSHKQSLAILKKRPVIIIAGSGMANGGRILNHFTRGLEDTRNTAIFVGFQAEETLGREITEGAKKIQIGKKVVNVKAKIEKLFGFSAHGDNNDLLDYVGRLDKNRLKKIFLVHAEEERSLNFKKELEEMSISAEIPEWKETFTLE